MAAGGPMIEAVIAAMSKFPGTVSLLWWSYPKSKEIDACCASCSSLFENPCLLTPQYCENVIRDLKDYADTSYKKQITAIINFVALAFCSIFDW